MHLEDVAANKNDGVVVAFETGKGRVTADVDNSPCLLELYALAEHGEGGVVRSEYVLQSVLIDLMP